MGLPERDREAFDSRPSAEHRLVLLRPVVEFDGERLKRLQDRMRDTRDP